MHQQNNVECKIVVNPLLQDKAMRKKLLMEMAPRRVSDRIASKVQGKEEEDLGQEEYDKQKERERAAEERKKEEEERQREKQQQAEKRQQGWK